jgi:hypothetical protein
VIKKISVVVAALMAVVCVQAQDENPHHEIGISYGLGVSLIGDGISNGLSNGIFDSLSDRKWTNEKQFGTLGVEYFYRLPDTPRTAVGGIFTFARYGEDVENGGVKVGERRRTYMSLMPSIKYYYVDGKNFSLYSKVAAGLMYVHAKSDNLKDHSSDSANSVIFMGQASLVGLEAGSQNLRCFMELGVGEQGIVLAGLKYKF